MALNQLNLIFGPKLPVELETVGLAFISAPTLRPDSAIGALSALRYAKENYDHLETALPIFQEAAANDQIDISISFPGIKNAFSDTGIDTTLAGTTTLLTGDWTFPILNSAIKVIGMHISNAGTWNPLIQPGLVYRAPYILAASGIEPSGSWIRRAIPEDGKDHNLILIYSIPEHTYTNLASGITRVFPTSKAKYQTLQEIGSVIDPRIISFAGPLDLLLEIKVNGEIKFTGQFDETGSDSFIQKIDKTLKQIVLKPSLAPDDYVELTYYAYNDFYKYSGYRDYNNKFWPFDANPEFGHVIGDDEINGFRLSADALLKQITLYAIPSAIIEIKEFVENDETQASLGTLNLVAYRAIDYGETHFVRHIISSEPTEEIVSRDSSTVINTWGYATLGKNFYDEQNSNGGDIFNLRVPSMLPLGRFVLGAPASVKSVSIADVRQRGGGVPEDFNMEAVETQENGIDTLRGFLDLGIWAGKSIKVGGVVEIKIDQSLLKTDPNDLNPNTFLASEIEEIVRNNVPPGIDAEILYVENL